MEGLGDLPLLSGVLIRGAETRAKAIRSYSEGARFRGIEESLAHIDTVKAIVERIPEIEPLAFLVDRVRGDIEVAVEATLIGYPFVAGDAMRDLMEIEFLLWDLTLDKDRIPTWLAADGKTLRRDYAPVAVRKRLRDSGAWNVGSQGESLDYAAHSASLHVTPRELLFKHGFEDDLTVRDAAFWELFEHLRRIFETFVLMRVAFPNQAWEEMKELDELKHARNAWARTRQMQDMFLSIWTGGVEGFKDYADGTASDPDPYPGWLGQETEDP